MSMHLCIAYVKIITERTNRPVATSPTRFGFQQGVKVTVDESQGHEPYFMFLDEVTVDIQLV